tara:strand:+ start:2269 stop:2466 length:198 start_codon:yes stop_codon:yes gene_type:complete
MTYKHKGRKYGDAHHRVRHSDETVEQVRQMHDDGVKPAQISRRTGISIDTVNDWIYYRTRTRVAV